MIRQAHTYLVGAMSGATLIAIAIAVFVVLVSAQVFRDWPLAALGKGGDETAAVSEARPAAAPSVSRATGSNAPVGAATGTAGGNAARAGGGSADDAGSLNQNGGVDTSTRAPGQTGSVAAGGDGGGDNDQGSSPGAPASTPSPTSSNPSSGSGSASSGGGSGGSSGGGNGGGATSAGSGGGGGDASTPTPSAQVTETVNNTVTKVDETALGGTLGNSGVTEVTESVVNGVAGPESAVGKVVDETVGAVGGLLHGKH
jgi:hypothetical protein